MDGQSTGGNRCTTFAVVGDKPHHPRRGPRTIIEESATLGECGARPHLECTVFDFECIVELCHRLDPPDLDRRRHSGARRVNLERVTVVVRRQGVPRSRQCLCQHGSPISRCEAPTRTYIAVGLDNLVDQRRKLTRVRPHPEHTV